MYKINEVSKLTGVSIRMLHHYDNNENFTVEDLLKEQIQIIECIMMMT